MRRKRRKLKPMPDDGLVSYGPGCLMRPYDVHCQAMWNLRESYQPHWREDESYHWALKAWRTKSKPVA